MFIARVPNRKSPPTFLIRESYREGGKVKSRTVANVTHWRPEHREAVSRALKGDFDGWTGDKEPVSGPIFGVMWALKQIADRLGITRSLGSTFFGKAVLLLLFARVAHRGSRLSAIRWSENHAVEEVIGLKEFSLDHLYEALIWVEGRQERIERRLYRQYVEQVRTPPVLVLYDVTSSYFEGEFNELAEYGHDRDGKKGKKQIVIGLITAPDGEPLAIRVFKGNTSDCVTIGDQLELLKQQFEIEEVVFVGDRGMVKSKGKQALAGAGYRYITALTDPQVRSLLKRELFQMSLFDEDVTEVGHGDVRYILRRNNAVMRKEAYRREDKIERLNALVGERNAFVKQSNRADPEAGVRQFMKWIKNHKIASFAKVELKERELEVVIDEEAMEKASLLDGCYVLETNVGKQKMGASEVDARYRDLQKVEANFRMMKTELLEVRPFFVRKASRTRGHAFIAMLGLKMAREMESCLHQFFGTTDDDPLAITIKDSLESLSRLCFLHNEIKDVPVTYLTQPDERQREILNALGVSYPSKASKRVGSRQK